MEQITLRIPERTLAEVEREADEHDVSRSEHIRDILDSHTEHGEHIEELERENDRLRREKRQILAQREENQQLTQYVENDKQWHEAALWTRLRWYLYGKE